MFRLHISLVLFAFVSLVRASHFYGGFISADQANETDTTITVKFSVRLGYRRSWIGIQNPAFEANRSTYCNETTIANQEHIAPYYYMFCDVGCTASVNDTPVIVGDSDIQCISFSWVSDWSYGEKFFSYTVNKDSNYDVYYSGANWITLNMYTINYQFQDWMMRIHINTAKRADTGKMNSSPKTLVPPLYIVRTGLSPVLNIPKFDTDGDFVRCRWALESKRECAAICETLPIATLNSTQCSLTFNTSVNMSSSSLWYGVAIQIEDFATSTSLTPISSTPLQFLVRIIQTGSTCKVPPILDTYFCMLAEVNKPFTMNMKATAGCLTVYIPEITITGPTGLRYSATSKVSGTTNQYYTTITWTPNMDQLGQQIICATAMDSSPTSSDVTCITVVVYTSLSNVDGPILIANSAAPKGTLIYSPMVFQVKINKVLSRLSRSAYIYIKYINGVNYLKFDVSNPSLVTLSVDTITNYTTILFTVPLNTFPSGDFYVAFDNPFAISDVKFGQYCSQIEVSGMDDPTFWNFSLPLTTTSTTTTTTTSTTTTTTSTTTTTTSTTTTSTTTTTTSTTTTTTSTTTTSTTTTTTTTSTTTTTTSTTTTTTSTTTTTTSTTTTTTSTTTTTTITTTTSTSTTSTTTTITTTSTTTTTTSTTTISTTTSSTATTSITSTTEATTSMSNLLLNNHYGMTSSTTTTTTTSTTDNPCAGTIYVIITSILGTIGTIGVTGGIAALINYLRHPGKIIGKPKSPDRLSRRKSVSPKRRSGSPKNQQTRPKTPDKNQPTRPKSPNKNTFNRPKSPINPKSILPTFIKPK